MSDQIAILEMLIVFGAVAAFCLYQIWSVQQPHKETNPRRKSKSKKRASGRKSRRR